MKHDNIPGSDGFTSEFFSIFICHFCYTQNETVDNLSNPGQRNLNRLK